MGCCSRRRKADAEKSGAEESEASESEEPAAKRRGCCSRRRKADADKSGAAEGKPSEDTRSSEATAASSSDIKPQKSQRSSEELIRVVPGLPPVQLGRAADCWQYVLVFPLETDGTWAKKMWNWDKVIDDPAVKARRFFTEFGWRLGQGKTATTSHQLGPTGDGGGDNPNFPEGMTKRDFHAQVRKMIIDILVSDTTGFQLSSRMSIDEDEVLVTLRLPDSEDVDTARVHADRYEIRMPVRPESYPTDDDTGATTCPTSQVRRGKFVGEDFVPMHLQFIREHYDKFQDFRDVDLIRLIRRKLDGRLNLDALLSEKIITGVFPMHNFDDLQKLNKKRFNSLSPISIMVAPFKSPCTNEVRDYFGEETAFFFHWMHYYIRMLRFPVALSILTFFRRLLDSRLQDYIEIGFGVFMCAWVAVFINLYNQDERFLVQRWGMSNVSVLVEPRTSFRLEKRGSCHESMQKMLVWFIAFFFVIWAIAATTISNLMTSWALSTPNEPFPVLGPTFGIQGRGQLTTAATLFQFINVKGADQVWKKLAPWLTLKENWKTDQEVERMTILRLFAVKAFIYYIPFWYIAFLKYLVEPDTPRKEIVGLLRDQLLIFYLALVASGVATNVLPVIKTFVLVRLEMWKVRHSHKKYTYLEMQAKNPTPEEVKYRDAIMEIIVSLGFLMMFTMVWPSLCILAFVVSIIQVRLISFSMSFSVKRPFPRHAEGMDAWGTILYGLSIASILCNVLIIIRFLRPFRDMSTAMQWVSFILAEHFFIIVKVFLNSAIPSKTLAQVILEETNEEHCDDIFVNMSRTEHVTPGVPIPIGLSADDHRKDGSAQGSELAAKQEEIGRATKIRSLQEKLQRQRSAIQETHKQLQLMGVEVEEEEKNIPSEVEEEEKNMPSKVEEEDKNMPSKVEEEEKKMPSKVEEEETEIPSKVEEEDKKMPSKAPRSHSYPPVVPMLHADEPSFHANMMGQPSQARARRGQWRSFRDRADESKSPLPSARGTPTSEFQVTIDTVDGSKLGVRLKKRRIEAIDDQLAVGKWNREHPSEALRRGDEICEVNGMTDLPEITRELMSQQTLVMRVQRWGA